MRNGIMTLSSSIRRKVALVIPLVTMMLLFGPGQAFGLTAAGQVITNEATVSYEDSLGNPFSATSNEAVVTVAEVYAATLEQDRTRAGAPGQTVYFQHFLENTGNATDSYTIETFRDDDRLNTSDDDTDDSDYFVYDDTNGNGEPNAGEPVVVDPGNPTGTITLAAGDTANLLVAFPIPGGAANGAALGATISVTSGNTIVDDLTGSNGNDGDEGTNNDLVNVTTGPALTLVKNANFDDGGTPNNPGDDGVVYTLQVTNNGGSAATNVDIIDVIPTNTIYTGTPITVAGLSAANSDLQMTGQSGGDATLQSIGTGTPGAFDIDETDVGLDGGGNAESLDFNQNGSTNETGLTSIYFRDASLAPNVTVSITYRVDIIPGLSAGTTIPNVFIADNTDSPQVTVTVPQNFDVDAADTGAPGNGSPDVNDGNDDDETSNDEQFVDRVSDGETVRFTNVITNTGNGADVLELSIANDAGAGAGASSCSAFPTGTSFTFYNAADTATLSNTNLQFGVDTGSLAAGASLNITVRAALPDGVSGAGEYCATLTARSFGAGTTSPVTDTKVERLGEIVPPTLDLANADYDTSSIVLPQQVTGTVTSPAAATASSETDGFLDGGDADTHPVTGVTSWVEIASGGIQDFELFIANEGVAPDSYNLTAPDLPAGWSVQFIHRGVDTDGDGTLDNTTNAGSTVTTTPLIPAGGVYQYTARVTVSGNQAEALANAPVFGNNTDVNADGDLDYAFTFTAASTTDGTSDFKLDAIDVADDAAVTVSPDSQDQVQPGGSVSYANTVTNTGNVTLNVTLTLNHSLAGFDNTTLIDTDGDGLGDTEYDNLTTGNITVDDGIGNDQTIEVVVANPGDPPVFTLEPGEVIPLDVTVQAPANAAQGDEDFFLIDATDGVLASDSATDRTEVVTVQVRLTKTVAVDTGCACDPGGVTFPPIAGSGATQATSDAEPGHCVIWKLEATNQSTQDALNVIINDAVTPFTTLEQPTAGTDDGLYYCKGSGCTPSSVTAAADADAGEVAGTDVTFDVGTLASGNSAKGTFCVVVD
jgi:uncharacterized repeat protein (TIGR01451 family)